MGWVQYIMVLILKMFLKLINRSINFVLLTIYKFQKTKMFLKKSVFLIGIKEYFCWKIEDNGNAVNSFYKQELHKTEQDGLIIEKVLKQKATSYLWSGKTMILFSITGYKNDICSTVF